MKTIILVFLFLIGNSCDPTPATKEVPVDNNPIESTDNSDENVMPPIQESSNPGEVSLKIMVKEIYDSAKEICGISKKNVMKMEVQEVIARGSSIVNLPNKEDEILMNFMLAPEELSANTLIEVKAKESLCNDASKTYFTIISFKVIE